MGYHWTGPARLVTAALFFYWGTLFVLTHIPLPEVEMGRNGDKLVHFVAYAGLAFLLIWTVSLRWQCSWKSYLVVFVVVAVYGAVDELLQVPIPSRHGNVADWIADVAGGAAGLAGYALLMLLVGQARISRTTRPETSVKRKSRPA